MKVIVICKSVCYSNLTLYLYQVSVRMRNWVLERWPEDTQVDLVGELPTLKAENRMLRQAAALRKGVVVEAAEDAEVVKALIEGQ
jgi:hypothetical protein